MKRCIPLWKRWSRWGTWLLGVGFVLSVPPSFISTHYSLPNPFAFTTPFRSADIEFFYGLPLATLGFVLFVRAARLRRRAAKAGFRWCPYCVHELIPDTRPAPTPHPSPPGPPNPAGDDAESAPPAERLWCTECGRSMTLKESEYLWIPENRRHDERRRRAERDPAA